MSDKQKDERKVPGYTSESGFAHGAPPSGVVPDRKQDEEHPNRPPTGGGIENGSNPESTSTATTDQNPNANR